MQTKGVFTVNSIVWWNLPRTGAEQREFMQAIIDQPDADLLKPLILKKSLDRATDGAARAMATIELGRLNELAASMSLPDEALRAAGLIPEDADIVSPANPAAVNQLIIASQAHAARALDADAQRKAVGRIVALPDAQPAKAPALLKSLGLLTDKAAERLAIGEYKRLISATAERRAAGRHKLISDIAAAGVQA